MRSLVLLETNWKKVVTSEQENDTRLTAIATDVEGNFLYAFSEATGSGGLPALSVSKLQERCDSDEVLAWKAEVLVSASIKPSSVIVSFKYLPESDSLCVVLANGDIEQIIEPAGQHPARENVGGVEAGIVAAAWSPDEETLALVTGDDKLIVMTKDFEVLSEGPLRTSDFGEDAPVNVGWGEKSTQFHGSVGKTAAAAAGPSIDTLQSSPDDDGLPRLSWRGDSSFFSCSSLDPQPSSDGRKRRTIRIFTRLAVLSSTSEPTGGLEHSLAWQPSGSIIASTQKRDESHHVVFFERNGLRRYDFALRDGVGKVRELAWNSDSSVLGVWLEKDGADIVQLWHRNNYQWYLKQELSPQIASTERMTSLSWHPEKALELYLATTQSVQSFGFCWDVFSSSRPPPIDDGAVAVVNGSTLNLTPFRYANIPPPMCSTTLTSSRLSKVPVHVSFSSTSTTLAVLYLDGFVEVWDWPMPASSRGKAREDVGAPKLIWTHHTEGQGYAVQSAVLGHGEDATVAVLMSRGGREGNILLVKNGEEVKTVKSAEEIRKIIATGEGFLLEAGNGEILEVPLTVDDLDFASPSEAFESLPEFCPFLAEIFPSPSSSPIVIGLTLTGRLYAGSRLLASDATSLTTTPDFLIFTTHAHEAKFIALFELDPSRGAEVSHVEPTRERGGAAGEVGVKRAVERGSQIVCVVPSSTSLVLQMPRGNLETVCPRPLVLQIVRQDLDAHRYRAAFLACRRHRIDLNILHDHDPTSFLAHLPNFVAQVKAVEHLNLFLSGLKNEDVTVTMYRPLIASGRKPIDTAQKVNAICDLLRAEIEQRDAVHYANTILTAHVRKKPPDHESALKVLTELKAKDVAKAEEAVKYIIFLSDANKLFDVALGMYDFSLVLLIAQQSQKDPREYLPFLRELRQLDTYLQRHRIDDHLERYDSALRNLVQAGPEHYEAVLAYTKKHALYETALSAVKDDAVRYKTVLVLNAQYLLDERRYSEAGLLFSLGGQPSRAVEAYQKANAWPELFTILLSEKRPAADIKALAIEVAESLRKKSRFAEAGRVVLDYGRDIDAAVSLLVEGTAFAEAIRLTLLYGRKDLLDTHIKPGTLECQSRIVEDIADVKDQLEKQVERFADLLEKKESNPTQYFVVEGPPAGLDGVELQPDGASDAGTAFTRYTAAPTTAVTSQVSSGRSARSRRRGGLKRAAGKKGTVFEEMYLLRSLKKTVENKMEELQTEVAALLPVLLSLQSTSHRQAAVELQTDLKELEAAIAQTIDALWTPREREWAEERAAEQREKEQGVFIDRGPIEETLEKVERPVLPSKTKWTLGLLDAL